MNAGLGRRSGAAAALLLALVVATPASPAGAAEGGPAITIESPRADAVLTSETVTVNVRVTAADSLLHRLKDVTMTAGADSRKFDCPDSPCSLSWEITRRSNGSYSVKAVATQVIILLGTPGPENELTRSFSVAAPAAKPVLDAPKVNEARSVDLSWSRNTEPDILYYAVFRKDPGGGEPQWVGGKIKQPTSGSKVSFTDTTTVGHAGGDFTYQVFAVRKGATDGSELVSGPSAARTATVPVLATTTTSTLPAPGTPPPGPTTTVKPGTSGGVDLSGFLSSRSAPVAPPVITVPEPPDTGFEGTLPFGVRPPSLDDIEEGEAEAVPPSGPRSIISRVSPGRPLVPVAGGLVLLMLAMHMRVLNRRTRPVADGGDLPVEAAPPPPAPPAPPAPPTRPLVPAPPPPAPAPAPALFDLEADDDEDWAPPADLDVEPEPERDPEAEPEPEPEPEVVTLWAVEPEPEPEPQPEPEPPAVDPNAIEVFEVVSSNRRRLTRSGTH